MPRTPVNLKKQQHLHLKIHIYRRSGCSHQHHAGVGHPAMTSQPASGQRFRLLRSDLHCDHTWPLRPSRVHPSPPPPPAEKCLIPVSAMPVCASSILNDNFRRLGAQVEKVSTASFNARRRRPVKKRPCAGEDRCRRGEASEWCQHSGCVVECPQLLLSGCLARSYSGLRSFSIETILWRMVHGSLGLTWDGMLAWMPCAAEPGNCIYVFDGIAVPYNVRQRGGPGRGLRSWASA